MTLPAIEELVARLGIQVRDPASVAQALVHSSYYNENPLLVPGDYERLELVGDAVVNLVVSDLVFRRFPDDDEGALTARRAALVKRPTLAGIALDLQLHRYLLLGRGEAQTGVESSPSVLAAVFEAIAGAIYLADGFESAEAWLRPIFELRLSAPATRSPKSLLQEWTQRTQHVKPRYELISSTSPPHAQRFTAAVTVDGRHLAVGEGSTRRAAEEEAAAAALDLLMTEAAGLESSPH